MQYLEVRRHTMRAKPGQHLTQEGVTLARRVGEGMGPFDRVIASDKPRALETAIAMGFAVDAQNEALSAFPEAVEKEMRWDSGFAEIAKAIKKSSPARDFARAQAELWHSFLRDLPDGVRVLIVSHGGMIEAGAIATVPDADHTAWGPFCDYCEGVRLAFDGDKATGIEILRVKT